MECHRSFLLFLTLPPPLSPSLTSLPPSPLCPPSPLSLPYLSPSPPASSFHPSLHRPTTAPQGSSCPLSTQGTQILCSRPFTQGKPHIHFRPTQLEQWYNLLGISQTSHCVLGELMNVAIKLMYNILSMHLHGYYIC